MNEDFENFLNEKLGTQARPSFLEEVRNFTRDQQMITCIDGRRKYYSVKEEKDPNDLVHIFLKIIIACVIGFVKIDLFVVFYISDSKL